jgi:glycine cleavage system H protein
MIPHDLYYTKTHEWIQLIEKEQIATIGITSHAAELLGDIVFVELPVLEENVATKDDIAVIESVKTASDLYSPFSGKIIAINETLEDEPEKINQDPYGDGWIFKIKLSKKDQIGELLSPEEYQEMVKE